LNSNVVQSVVNDTNVTGSISAQTLTLGWTGTLADGRIASASTWNAKIGGSGTTNELAYFTAGSTIGSLTTATYPSLTELSYVKGVTSSIQTQFAAISQRKVVKTTTRSTITTSGSPQIITSLLIPANTFAVGDILACYSQFSVNYATSTARIIPFVVYFNTTPSTAGALSVLTASNFNTTGSTYSFALEFYLGIQSSTVTVVRTLASQGSRTVNLDETITGGTGGTYPQSRSIDWTVNQYLLIVDGGATSGGTYTNEWLKIES
jgi:hypothetical protein